eukprot:7060323-Prymnesium_polylepis.1
MLRMIFEISDGSSIRPMAAAAKDRSMMSESELACSRVAFQVNTVSALCVRAKARPLRNPSMPGSAGVCRTAMRIR